MLNIDEYEAATVSMSYMTTTQQLLVGCAALGIVERMFLCVQMGEK